MSIRKVIIHKPVATYFEDFTKLHLSRRKRVKKTVRKRANAAVNVLKQIGWLVPKRCEYEDYQSVVLDAFKIQEFIVKHAHDLIARYGFDKMTVVIGRNQFRELTNELLSVPFMIDCKNFNQPNQIYGMTLIALPWIDGVVCVPEHLLPEKSESKEPKPTTPEPMGEAAIAWNNFMGRPL